jgi:hypothetical protein
MLAGHPCVATGPETHFFKMASKMDEEFRRERQRDVGLPCYLAPEEMDGLIADLFHAIASKVPPPRQAPWYFLEKTPEHTMYVPLILRCCPTARFIHLVRDGRHVVASQIRVERQTGIASPNRYASVAAAAWRQHVETARTIPELAPGPDRYYELRYEDLRRSPVKELRSLFRWLGQPLDEAELETIVRANDLEQVVRAGRFETIRRPGEENRPPEQKGFFGQGATDSKSFDLTRLQEYRCYLDAGPLLHELGYCSEVPKVPWWAKLACAWRLRRLLGLSPV